MMTTSVMNRYESDFAYCEDVIKRHSKSFYRAFSSLETQKAQCVYAIYAFCRLADDAIDEHNDIEELSRLEYELERFLAGSTPDTPVWRSLHLVFDSFDMNAQAFRDMIEGQKRDYRFCQPDTQQELEDYCYYVAGTVGLMLAPLLSVQHLQWRDEAIALGVAMQITNILRDVGEDYDCGRVYFPVQEVRRHAYSEAELAHKQVDERFIALWEAQAARAEYLYHSFERALPLLDYDAVIPVVAASKLYGGILQAVRENKYDCLTQRAVVSEELSKELISQAFMMSAVV